MNQLKERRILLVTPPFTQLNTPYPATQYIKGYLNTLGMNSYQLDLSLETFLVLFSAKSLAEMFSLSEKNKVPSDSRLEMLYNRQLYLSRIDPVIQFLQGKNPSLSHLINTGNFLPEGPRFKTIDDLEWAFGELGHHDKAKYLATLFLEDIGDFIRTEIDADFGFSRYAERISRAASDFTPLHDMLQSKETHVTKIIRELTIQYTEKIEPDIVCITVPFPGNVYSAFLIASVIKTIRPETICVLGGGYVNTELRTVSDERVFRYFDYITLDDGETPLRKIIEKSESGNKNAPLKRTFICKGGVVYYQNDAIDKDVPQREVGTPDYSDLYLDKYISVLEVLNPMHRKWSDGRWNKMTLAHGCYWGKCTFCDVSLDYIGRYEPVDAAILCDRIVNIVQQTGENGFHFVDEAAPPSLLKDLAIEILKRKLNVSWWTNIRFEKTFSYDVCRLLSAAGCIAVTGGLEVASDRLLDMIQKGVTVRQVARVAHHFTKSNILVHAYLMYGFPTQTEQETIDSMEIVRQMLETGIIKSGFWHQFAMTSHSPVGLNPAAFNVVKTGPDFAGFADNDCFHEDPSGCDHEKFSEGLSISLLNYMQGAGFDLPLSYWFDFPVPETSIPRHYISSCLHGMHEKARLHQIMIWTGGVCKVSREDKQKMTITAKAFTLKGTEEFEGNTDIMRFIVAELEKMDIYNSEYSRYTVESFKNLFESTITSSSFEEFEHSYIFFRLREIGLLIV